MILVWILILPLLSGIVAWRLGEVNQRWARAAMTVALAVDTLLLIGLWRQHSGFSAAAGQTEWMAQFSAPWIPQLGIRFDLAMDGLALLMALLTCVTGLVVILTMNRNRANPGLHALLLMTLITAMLGVFLAADLILFFVGYEVMLLPAYGLIVLYGDGDVRRAATRFFVFTQAAGLLMFIAILGLHVSHYQTTGEQTFAYSALVSAPLQQPIALLFLAGFFMAFAVKLPLVPFHTWQPEAYACAPPEASILFSAIMAKTAGYGLLRFVVPLFPEAVAHAAPWAMTLGVVTILYASWLAYGQTDLKRLIAYSSAGHLGYVVLGAFALNDLGTQGAIMLMVCHGISVTGLFLLADVIEQHTGTRDLERLGGLWQSAPRLGSIALFFALATLGLPGIGNFIGEFLVLVGAFQSYPVIAAIAVIGTVFAAAYSLRLMQRVFFGPQPVQTQPADIPAPAFSVCVVLIGLLVWLGLYPQPVLDAARLAHDRSYPAVIATPADRPAGDRP